MVEAVVAAGGHAALTELPSVAHDAWRYALTSPAVREWMLSTSPGVPDAERLLQGASNFSESGGADALDGEFRAALTVPRAVSIHIGDESLQTLASGAPSAVDPHMLAGKIDDLQFAFSAVGESFQIRQSEISYNVQLSRIQIDPQADGLLRLRAGLHPLTLTIGATRVHSATRSAVAGPIDIRLGPHYPLWIEIKVKPVVQDGRLHLETRHVDFSIPDDNWIVTAPDDVTVSGPDMTPDLARTALVGGLYTRRTKIEECVRDMLPHLVSELEQRLQPASIDRIVAGIWPIPVFRPRLRILPEEVLVDDSGLSLVLGLAAAPLNDAQAAAAPVVLPPLGPAAAELPHTQTLELGVASGVLEALSGMIVDSHAAHIDVRDMPEPEFALLADRAELVRILPELARLGDDIEVRTELDLAAPLIVQRSEFVESVQFTSAGNAPSRSADSLEKSAPAEADINSLAARFEIPRLVVSILVRDRAASREWRPYAKFDVRLTHSAKLHLALDGHAGRMVELKWSGAPAIEVAGGYLNAPADWDAAVDRGRLAMLVGDCWRAWTGSETVLRQDVPDLVLGTAHLRIDTIQWRGVELVASYRTPETRITNSGTRLIDYAVRGQYSPWGPRLQLKPGETKVYSSTSALIVRRYPEPESTAITVTVGSELDLAAPAP
ncbi:MAG: hypothetical protein JNG89_14035 [Planctomycetaceae bacterium]|nr:hypothetical protein [Planctomycetaceae bacterium]